MVPAIAGSRAPHTHIPPNTQTQHARMPPFICHMHMPLATCHDSTVGWLLELVHYMGGCQSPSLQYKLTLPVSYNAHLTKPQPGDTWAVSYRSYGTVTPPSNVETCYDARCVNACLRFFRMLLKSSEKGSGASPSGSKDLGCGWL